MSLKSKIDSRKRSTRNCAALHAAFAGTAVGIAAARNWPALLLIVAAANTLSFALNGYMWLRARQAQRIYDSSPAAAYIAEVQHAFGAAFRD